MQPTSTELHQSVELFDQLLSPLNEAGNSFSGYIKEGKTEKEKNNQKQSKRKALLYNKLASSTQVNSLQNYSQFCFCFCFVFMSLINVPAKNGADVLFFYFRSLRLPLPRASAQNTRGFLVFTHAEWQQNFS